MQIGIPAETRAGELRVAATPETVKKLAGGGLHRIVVQAGAGARASALDADYQAAGATIVASAAEAFASDIVLKVRGPEPGELAMLKKGGIVVGLLNPWDAAALESLAQAGRHGLRHGMAAAHHARTGHGRALVAGQHRRLQGGDARRQRVRPLHADADDRRRHGEGRARR